MNSSNLPRFTRDSSSSAAKLIFSFSSAALGTEKTKQIKHMYLFKITFNKPYNSTQSQAAISFKISNLLICFCSFDLSCPILGKDNFIENLYIVLSCLIK